MKPWKTLRATATCAAVIALAACDQLVSPVQPSRATSTVLSQSSSMALVNSHQEIAIVNAIGNCRGPVLTILRSLLGRGDLVSVQDENGLFAFQLSSQGHTSCHTIEYEDIVPPDGLSCGDEVTSVDAVACPF